MDLNHRIRGTCSDSCPACDNCKEIKFENDIGRKDVSVAQTCKRCKDFDVNRAYCDRHKKPTSKWQDWCDEKRKDWEEWRLK